MAQSGPASIQEDHGGFFASVWSFLTDLLLGEDGLDNRCGIDPNGCPEAGASLDTRCTIDPDGCPDAGTSLDNRCTIDPNGGVSCEPGF
jgi:hypothetical protein